jgi:hypothetical protein
VISILRVIDRKAGIYALDSESGIFKSSNIILMELGKILERSLTMDSETFKRSLLKLDHPE